jgi:SAM-dependent methyltransferase
MGNVPSRQSGQEENHYERWDDAECVRRFSEKDEFFKTEIRHLSQCAPFIETVLDIGCASGRLIELLRNHNPQFDPVQQYMGIDIGSSNIESARILYQGVNFENINALEFRPVRQYDLVVANGVFQHEPQFEDLLKAMVRWSKRYVMFDVKLAAVPDHVLDRAESCTGPVDKRLHFNLLNYPRLKQMLYECHRVASVEGYGYLTNVNSNTILPRSVKWVVSAGFLLKVGERPESGLIYREDFPREVSCS